MNNFWKESLKWVAAAVVVGATITLVVWLLSMLKAFLIFILWVVGIASVAFSVYYVKKFIDKYLAKKYPPVVNTPTV